MKTLLLVAAVLGSSLAGAQTNVSTLEHQLSHEMHLHGHHLPMMFVVSGLASHFTGGGVKGMKIVTYEGLPAALDHQAVGELARKHLGESWSLMLREQQKAGDQSFVWVQPAGDHFRMLVMDLEANELDLVQMELSPDQLKKWQEQHGG